MRFLSCVEDCNIRIVTAPQNSHLTKFRFFPGICKDEPITYVSLYRVPPSCRSSTPIPCRCIPSNNTRLRRPLVIYIYINIHTHTPPRPRLQSLSCSVIPTPNVGVCHCSVKTELLPHRVNPPSEYGE